MTSSRDRRGGLLRLRHLCSADVVTNADLEDTLDTSDAWITERTGIRERRVGGTTTGLGIEAGQQAMDRAGVTGHAIDLVLLCTSTPDEAMPASASGTFR